MADPAVLFSGSGFVYRDGKVAGRKSGIEIHSDALYIIKSGVGGTVAAIAGGAAGALVDHAAITRAKESGKLEAYPFAQVVSVELASSLLNGKGIVFTLADGHSLKVKPDATNVKRLFEQVGPAARAANPQVRIA